MRRSLVVLLCLAAPLAGCNTRPGPEMLLPVAVQSQSGPANFRTIYVATSRQREAPAVNVFGKERSEHLNYAEFTISIPPGHEAGEVELPKRGRPDPARNFAVVRQNVLSEAGFASAVGASRDAVGPVVFVHGFNQNFQESLFRLAQISADANLQETSVLFSWPSEAHVTGYVADKEAVTASRDALVHLLTGLTIGQGRTAVAVVAHSMGSWLTIEALRQLRLTGRGDVLDRLDITLASPDIDVDVFRAQMTTIGPLKRPMTILVSPDDRALAVSSRIAGKRPRLGALDVSDPRVVEAAMRANIQFIDISTLHATSQLNHDRYVSLAVLYPQLEDGQGPAGLRRAGAFVFNAIGLTLSSPFTLAGRVLQGE